jgi:hypothetical protein
MEATDALLERFEKTIDMPAYLASRGFVVSKRDASADYLAMASENGNVLRLTKESERGVWTYVNPASPGDSGSLVSYLERHEGLDRKTALDRLIACADERGRERGVAAGYHFHRRNKPDDLRRAEAIYIDGVTRRKAATRMLERLGIATASFDAWRFGAIRGPEDVASLLADPAQGTLSPSRYRATDRKLVIVERPIDAVAFEARHGRQQACYVATGANLDPERGRRLAHLLADARGIDIVVAYGRDRRGEELAARVQALAPMSRIERLAPAFGARWADQAQLELRHARSLGDRAPGRPPGSDRGLG